MNLPHNYDNESYVGEDDVDDDCCNWSGDLWGQLIASSKLESYSSLLSEEFARQDGHLMHHAVDEILQIVSEYPSLAARGPYDGTLGKTPLEMLLLGNARLDQVRVVAEMAAKAKLYEERRQIWSGPGWEGKLPIHLACACSNSAVIDHIAQACPLALTVADKRGRLPIDLVLERRAARDRDGPSLPTIQRMLRLCPQSIAVVPGDGDQIVQAVDGSWNVAIPLPHWVDGSTTASSTAFQRLLFRNYNELELLETMVEVFPAACKTLHIAPQRPRETLTMDTNHAIALAKLFWKLRELHLEATLWTNGAFCTFMSHLAKGPRSFQRLWLSLPVYSLSLPGSETRQALRLALGQNQYLTQVHLDVCVDDIDYGLRGTNTDVLLLHALVEGLQKRPRPLDKLELCNFLFPNASDVLGLMSGRAAPRVLILKGLRVTAMGLRSLDTHPPRDSKLEEVELFLGRGSMRPFVYLLTCMTPYPGRWKLSLHDSDPGSCFNITDQVVELLHRSPRLYSLQLRGFELDSERVVAALKDNRSLRKLGVVNPEFTVTGDLVRVLEHHNATVEEIDPIVPAPELQTKFEYLLRLNKFGRALIRDPDCTITTLVELLSKLPSDSGALRYGLMLERPELWATDRACNRSIRKVSDMK